MSARQALMREIPPAELIAAAPELLAALKAIMVYTGEYPSKRPYCGGSFLSEKLFEDAAAAIAKAEGGK